MEGKPQKLLVDTSMVPCAIGLSTIEQIDQFEVKTQGAKLHSSIYVRMEFIRRWVCPLIKLAAIAAQRTSPKDFFIYVANDFSCRNLKTVIQMVGDGEETLRSARSSLELSEGLALQALVLLKRFDRRLASRVTNKCRCEVGGLELKVDFNSGLRDFQEFYFSFDTVIENCGINRFLNLNNAAGTASKLLANSAVDKIDPVIALKKLRDGDTTINCPRCARIGDPVVALELPAKFTLIHGDKKAFPAICSALSKSEITVDSAIALADKDPNMDWSIARKRPRSSES